MRFHVNSRQREDERVEPKVPTPTPYLWKPDGMNLRSGPDAVDVCTGSCVRVHSGAMTLAWWW